jgi:predicted SprT family Zn-dependent metalloprotease
MELLTAKQHPLVEKAKLELGITDSRDSSLAYSGRFTPYNGNVRLTRWELQVRLAKEWRDKDEDVQLGIIEHLLAKLFRRKVKTHRMALYQDFILYIGRETEKVVEDDVLLESFKRVNSKYFDGRMEVPSVKWGRDSFRKLGHYHYASDTVMLSTVLEHSDTRFLDYVMYHELLHKKHGLTKGGRAHTKAFKADEALYEEASEAELTSFLRRQKRKLF